MHNGFAVLCVVLGVHFWVPLTSHSFPPETIALTVNGALGRRFFKMLILLLSAVCDEVTALRSVGQLLTNASALGI